VATLGGGCGDATSGTSFATSMVSGVVALMLQVNPDLMWRDVMGILTSMSQKTDPKDPSWSINAAGLHHSYLYGFGLVNVAVAIDASRTWESYPSEQQVIKGSGLINLPIPDFPADSVNLTVTFAVNNTFVTESIVVLLDLEHTSHGHLDILLTSPQGTESLLHTDGHPENSQVDE
jgi:subtilisin family serine protease